MAYLLTWEAFVKQQKNIWQTRMKKKKTPFCEKSVKSHDFVIILLKIKMGFGL